jgi:hypothetical protein
MTNASDAMHDRTEDDRSNHHLDQPDEGVAERLHCRRGMGIKPTQGDTEDHAGQNLER